MRRRDTTKRAPAALKQQLRTLPAVDALLQREAVQRLVQIHGRDVVLRSVRSAVDEARAAILSGSSAQVDDADIERRVLEEDGARLRSVINATGVIVHTNLGRAPLADEAVEALQRVARGYCTIEYDLERGERGDRHQHVVDALRRLTGAEDAAVVNNNAAAVLIAVAAVARGRDVVVSRGELVEIGGGFRIPDVIRESGAQLVEVGTTNRTHARDFEAALNERTGALLKVHRSNFAMVGFTAEVSVAELARIARGGAIPLLVDAGSGLLQALPSVRAEETVSQHLRAGADVVTFSGDKLLGGPQAGILAGRRDLIERVRRHPLMRAARPDKLCLAALDATLRLWLDAPHRIPLLQMLSESCDALEARAHALVARLAGSHLHAEVVPSTARVGGGASPLTELESRAVRLVGHAPEPLAAALRQADPPVVARIEEDAVLLDLRTVAPPQDAAVARALLGVRAPEPTS